MSNVVTVKSCFTCDWLEDHPIFGLPMETCTNPLCYYLKDMQQCQQEDFAHYLPKAVAASEKSLDKSFLKLAACIVVAWVLMFVVITVSWLIQEHIL